MSIPFDDFYQEFHGHCTDHLEESLAVLRKTGRKSRSCIYLAGDSSLDNKYWFTNTASAINGYEKLLSPSKMRKDVAFFLNSELVKRKETEYFALNCAVEESTVESRAGGLLPQDQIIRDSIQENDILVVSVGGNDIALAPSLQTILSILMLLYGTSTTCLDSCTCGTSCPCTGSLWGCASNCVAWPLGYGHFVHLFRRRVQAYLEALTCRNRPRAIAICMIYYPDERAGNSWADAALAHLGYNENPRKLQVLIDKLFRDATQQIKIQGTRVIPIPLAEAMNGKVHTDYCDRVEPSVQGGKKMAELILDSIFG